MKIVIPFLVFVLLTLPAAPAVAAYQLETRDQLIAYLLGRIEQLQTILDMVENGGVITTSRSGDEMKLVTIDTRRADEITDTSAILRGEVQLFGGAYATVWFEYGKDSDFLDLRSSQMKINSVYDSAFRRLAKGLEEDEKYYYRIVGTDHNGNVLRGSLYSFRTDETDG